MARIIWFLVGLLASLLGHGQLRINEVCSKNVSVHTDAYGEATDWVEVHNSSGAPIALGSHYLTDDEDVLQQWALPDVTLETDAYLVLCHGTDNSDGLHFPFSLDGDGESLWLYDANLGTLSEVHVPALHPDHSAGRDTDGNWQVYVSPTPGAANSSTPYPGYAPTPTFSVAPGAHNGPLAVSITGCPDCTVHCTTDGQDPDGSAPANVGEVVLNATGVLKAIAYRNGHLPSNIATASYLIDEGSTLPVISISTHPDSLFDDTLGIYMLGPEADTVYPFYGANFWDERGIAVHLEYFDAQGVRRIDQDVELRIHGGRASRNKPQRPLRLTARDRYGDDRIRYGLFPEKPELERFKRLILRNSGSDWCQAHYRDGFFHQIALHAGLDIDVLAFKPSVVFLNGAYWGIHNIRERVDEDYLASNHGVDPDSLLLMDEENHVIQGDSLHFDSLQQFIRTHDMANEANYRHVDSLLDIASFMDYFALEMFSGNSDWPSNNLKYWKPSVHTGKWRYLMYDLDATMHAAPWLPNDFDMFYWLHVHREGYIHAEIYQSLIQRPEFRRVFLNRLADLMNTCLGPAALHEENERIRNTIRAEVPHHFERWSADPQTWHEQSGQVIPEWIDQRGDFIREDVLSWYDLPNTVALRFDVFPPEAANLQVNTIHPSPPFDGIYFNGNDLDLSVHARPGFSFSHWTYTAEPGVPMRSTSLRRSFAADGAITAHFAKDGTTLYAVPNPATETCTVSYSAPAAGPLVYELWDAQGRLLRRWSTTVVEGTNALALDLRPYAAGMMEIRIDQEGTRSTIRVAKQ